MAQYATLKAAIQAVIKQNGNNEITGELLQQALLSMINSLGVGYQFVGIATPATNPGTPDQNVFYIATERGTYTNFSNLVVAENEVAIFKYNGTWSKETTGAASVEKVNQLGQEAIYDVSARNGGVTFASLSALLSDENIGTLIPVAVRCGGMSIRFVQSSDNKYVQWRLEKSTFSIDVDDWYNDQIGANYPEYNCSYYKPSIFENDKFINHNDGSVSAFGGLSAGDYVEIGNKDTIVLENFGGVSTADARGLAFYNSNKEYISGFQYPASANRIIVTAPANSRYVRFTVTTSLIATYKFILFYSNIINEKISNPASNIVVSISSWISDTFIRKDIGIERPGTSLSCTDFIPVLPNFKYIVRCCLQGNMSGCFYDKDKAPIISSQIVSTSNDLIDYYVTSPSNAAYIRFSTLSSLTSQSSLKGEYTLTDISKYLVSLNAQQGVYYDVSMFDNMGVCGDSYTKAGFFDAQGTSIGNNSIISWGKILGRMKGIDVSIYASSGADTQTWQERTDCLPALLNDSPKRLYIFNLCINDYGHGIDLGTISDIHEDYTENPNTYYGNWGRIIDKVLNFAPAAKIILMKCWLVDQAVYDYSSVAIENICAHYGIPFISPSNHPFFRSEQYANKRGGHPTPTQQSGMAKAMCELISECMQNNPTYFDDYFPQN